MYADDAVIHEAENDKTGKRLHCVSDVFLSFSVTSLFVILGVDSYLAISSYPPRQLVKYPPLLQVGLTLSSYIQFLHS